MADPRDPRTRILSRIRYWNRRRSTAVLRVVEQLVTGHPKLVQTSRHLAHIPPTSNIECIEMAVQTHPPEVVQYSPKLTTVSWLPLVAAVDASWMYVLRDPSVAVVAGAVWLPSGKPALELFGGVDRYSASQDVRGLSRKRPRQVISGTWLLMPSHTYYHFLLEDAPALLASLDFSLEHHMQVTGTLVARDAPTYVTEFLATLNVPVRIVDHQKVQVERLIATGFESGGRVHPASVERVRKHFDSNESPRLEQIYVSRVGLRRAPEWEQSLIDALTTALPRLRVIEAQNLTHREQVALFAQAELVIGMHGAGLSNLLFSPRTTRVIEIGSETNMGDHFWRLSSVRGQDYELVWITPEMTQNVAIDTVLASVLGT